MSRMNEREIARKLAEREDFEPPAGLLEKIKGEIPPSIPVGTETPEVETWPSVAPRQRWLMAASVVAMIGAGLLALQVRMQVPAAEETVRSKSLLQGTDQAQEAAPGGPPPAARLSPPQEAEAPRSVEAPPPPPSSPKPLSRKEMDEPKSLGYVTPQGVEVGVEGGVVGGVPGGAVGGVGAPREAESPVQAVEAPESVAASPAAAPAPQAAAKEENRADAAGGSPLRIADAAVATAESAKPGLEVRRKSAEANPFKDTATQPLSTFETDAGTASYELVRRSLLQGKLPDPGAIRVGEVLNGFETGGVPPVEGAPTPFRDPRHRLLCFRLPAGHRVEVEFNPEAVTRYRLLGNGISTLYEIELRPEAPRDRRVLTLRLGATEKAVLLSALAPSWEKASPGFRLTALAAELAEILKGNSRVTLAEVARQAREAQKDLAKSARAAELADLVEKAARIKGGGSGSAP
ncbi:MAG: von Willebrand factor type A domain-containing protein [Thermoanaerobaculia bacterium]